MRQGPGAEALLTSAQVARLRQRSNRWGMGLVLHAWTVIGLAFGAAVWWPNPLVWILSAMVIGSRQLGLLILMHDAAHGMLARTPAVNRVLGQVFCAWPMFADQDLYRRYHLRHHAHTLQAEDPDRVLTGHYPISRASLRRKLLRDLLGQTGFAQRRSQFAAALGSPDARLFVRLHRFLRSLGPALLANGVILGVLSGTGHALLYPLLWIVPALTWHQLVLRVRNIAEHAAVPDPDDPFQQARTTHANLWARIFVAPYWVNYHLEHHLLMWVPCYRLPEAAQALESNGHGARRLTSQSYLDVLRAVTTRGEGRDGESGPPRARALGTFSDGFDAAGPT
jgi:fatty acid desaturase